MHETVQKTEKHQQPAKRTAAEQGGMNGGANVPEALSAEQAGNHDRAADIAAHGEGKKNKGNFIRV